MYVCMYVFMHVCIMYLCMYVCMFVMYVCVCVCMCVLFMHVCICLEGIIITWAKIALICKLYYNNYHIYINGLCIYNTCCKRVYTRIIHNYNLFINVLCIYNTCCTCVRARIT